MYVLFVTERRYVGQLCGAWLEASCIERCKALPHRVRFRAAL